MMLTKKRGFTLIELLVVIAIIALLMAIIMPALNIARDKAAVIVCLANQKSLVTAWHTYTADNDDRIVNGYVHEKTMSQRGLIRGPGSWVEPPQDENGMFAGQPDTDIPYSYRENGYRKGLLFDGYLDSVDVLHCPKDMRYKRGTVLGSSEAYQIYRTYSIPDGASANGAETSGYRTPKKTSEMRNPVAKYIMVEEAYDGRSHNYNDSAFSLNIGKTQFWDPLRIDHNKGCTLGFADAHAEYYKFKDADTVEYFSDRAAYIAKRGQQPCRDDGNEDVEYFLQNWPGLYNN